ncbi:hypothetical protein BTM25_30770 [Actinomadura rubteroloni]|uniref:Putative adhesin Stv domain-containing protein n=1 Tax=Actinomadura rubteroloni TaxID=1926885 RepID=A0A2P4UHG8_9ACTN|nr:hypothetical protein [Actinomadura rubteroloni]POM24448.1 hypothetical protein BTM25_30770 [Actinomadura rubteroloni]
MGTYIISSHGEPKWDKKTTIPQGVSVRFYQKFGVGMDSAEAFKLQSALTDPTHADASAVLERNPQRALWNGPNKQQPELELTADPKKAFKSGIVHAESREIVAVIELGTPVTLTDALQAIATHAAKKSEEAVVHCLFCL